eukprot:607742-Lingulodinium_polyedra.AAC.1
MRSGGIAGASVAIPSCSSSVVSGPQCRCEPLSRPGGVEMSEARTSPMRSPCTCACGAGGSTEMGDQPTS